MVKALSVVRVALGRRQTWEIKSIHPPAAAEAGEAPWDALRPCCAGRHRHGNDRHGNATSMATHPAGAMGGVLRSKPGMEDPSHPGGSEMGPWAGIRWGWGQEAPPAPGAGLESSFNPSMDFEEGGSSTPNSSNPDWEGSAPGGRGQGHPSPWVFPTLLAAGRTSGLFP